VKVIGLVASPRKNGNTDILLRKALEGARAEGAETEIYYLNELSIRGCQGCYGCKKTGKCVIKDDLVKVFAAIDEANSVILGSPVYFGRFTAQLALLMDRLYAYIKPDFTSHLGSGKKFGLVFTQGQADDGLYTELIRSTAKVLERIGFVAGPGALVGAGLREAGAVRKQELFLQEAFAIGRVLAVQ